MIYRQVASLKTPSAFRDYLAESGIPLDFDAELHVGADAPLAQACRLPNGFVIGNRFAVLPMEGWDGTPEGHPTELTFRRWRHFGASGAKLIWGCESVAVRFDGRANPNQLIINESTLSDFIALRQALVAAHEQQWHSDDLLIGLQLTHSGRFACPRHKKRLEPIILYHHPILDRKFGIAPDSPVISDDEIARVVDDFVTAARLAQRAGFAFVDIKHCHGYLGHEFLSDVERPGRYGGSFENRTRFLREIVAGIHADAPGLEVGVRVSAFDFVPFRPNANRRGEPEPIGADKYRYAFGGDGTGVGIDLSEPRAFLDLLASLRINLVCISAGSPYYNPHIQRPAFFPPSDGYEPPENPLMGVARLIQVTTQLKHYRPELTFVGSGYSYLQEWLPNVAQYVVRTGQTDLVGLGRMVLTYPEMIADVLAGRPLQHKRICRTFSDCTTAPRNGWVSGCYRLDEFYRSRSEAQMLRAVRAKQGT